MRILITADLHSRRDWFDWLLRQQAVWSGNHAHDHGIIHRDIKP